MRKNIITYGIQKKIGGQLGTLLKKKRKKQIWNTLIKDSENQTGEKLKFLGLSPIEDFEELLRQGKLERVPGTDDLYKLKQHLDLI